MVNAQSTLDAEAASSYARAVAGRAPVAYPRSAGSYSAVAAAARAEQADAMRRRLSSFDLPLEVVAARMCAVAGADVATASSLASLRSGAVICSPRVASILGVVLGCAARDVAPHVESMPWLSGRFRPAMAGREWVSVAADFPDAVLSAMAPGEAFGDVDGPGRGDGDDARADHPAGSEDLPPPDAVDIRAIMERIGRVVSARSTRPDATASEGTGGPRLPDGVDTSGATGAPVAPEAPHVADAAVAAGAAAETRMEDEVDVAAGRRQPPSCPGEAVMMSLGRTGRGVRFFYRGAMPRRRLDLLEEVLDRNAWAFGPADTVAVDKLPGRPEILARIDVEIEDRLAGAVLRALGEPLPAPSRGILRRLLG